MARTRASKGKNNNSSTTKPSSTTTTSTPKSKYTLPPPSTSPPKIFILPSKATNKARIVSLLHPRYAKPTRYLACPETGFYEFTRIAAPKSTPRSWLIQTESNAAPQAGNRPSPTEGANDGDNNDDGGFGAYVTNGAELFVATPIDALFLILPAVLEPATGGKSERRRYVSSDDHFDRIQAASPHLWEVLRWGEGRLRGLLEARLGAICDTLDAGGERVYLFSEDKLLAEILGKARRMSARPLPRSMEDKFVVRPLEAPVVGVKREAAIATTPIPTTTTTTTNTATTTTSGKESTATSASGTPGAKPAAGDSQSSASSTDSGTSSASEASTAATSISAPASTSIPADDPASTEALRPAMEASAEVMSLQRLRTSFDFLCSRYVPTSLAATLRTRLTTTAAAAADDEFAPLDAYLAALGALRREAAAARSASDYTRKRGLDDEELAERAEKRRRKEDDDKRRRAGESRGVRELKKVDTAGMRKMSDFFKKKT